MKPQDKTFTIECTMRERWVPQFLSMLKYMEQLGGLGGSRKVAIYSDGDGDFRPKFSFSIDWSKVEPIEDNNGNRLYDAG
jgi:hypothetical protein